MRAKLRDYQRRNAAEIRAGWAQGFRRLLYVAPTGSGKTHVAAVLALWAIVHKLGGRVLFLVHRRELVDQAIARLLAAGVSPSSLGVMMASHEEVHGTAWVKPNASIQVASVQTFTRRKGFVPTLIIVDEAHHSAADSYAKILASFPKALVLGLTATPYRLDGKGLREQFDRIVPSPGYPELIGAGFIMAPHVYGPPDAPDLRGVKTARGDYELGELSKRVAKRKLVGDIVEHYKNLGGGLPAVCYAVDVRRHAPMLVAAFRKAGVSAESISWETPSKERDAILARLRSGDTKVVVNCNVLTEGWDAPEVKVCILARPTRSTALYMQMVGRILRPWKDGEGQFIRPIVLDHAGNVGHHGFPHAPRDLSLDGSWGSGRAGESLTRRCPECGRLNGIQATACEGCGAELPELRPVPDVEDAELVRARLHEAERADLRRRLEKAAPEAGWSPADVDRLIAAWEAA